MKTLAVSLAFCLGAISVTPTAMDDPIFGNDTTTPLKKSVKFSMFPDAGLYVVPTQNGGYQRAHSAGAVDSDVLSVGCMPGTIGRGGYATVLCPMPNRGGQSTARTGAPEPTSAEPAAPEGPTFEEQLVTVLSAVNPPSAELHIQPDQDWVYTQIPTLAYFARTSGSQHGSLGGVEAQVDWFASEFRIQFEPGAAPVVSRIPGGPYPNQQIEYTYTSEGDFRPVATIMWGAEVKINGRTIRFERLTQTRVEHDRVIHAKDGYTVLTVNPRDRTGQT